MHQTSQQALVLLASKKEEARADQVHRWLLPGAFVASLISLD